MNTEHQDTHWVPTVGPGAQQGRSVMPFSHSHLPGSMERPFPEVAQSLPEYDVSSSGHSADVPYLIIFVSRQTLSRIREVDSA